MQKTFVLCNIGEIKYLLFFWKNSFFKKSASGWNWIQVGRFYFLRLNHSTSKLLLKGGKYGADFYTKTETQSSPSRHK